MGHTVAREDYIEVSERLAAFYEKYPDGSIQAVDWQLREIPGMGWWWIPPTPQRATASDKSIKMMWALLRQTGMPEDVLRAWVSDLLGVPAEWSTPDLTQQHVSQVIDALRKGDSHE